MRAYDVMWSVLYPASLVGLFIIGRRLWRLWSAKARLAARR